MPGQLAHVELTPLQRLVEHLEWARDLTIRQSILRRPVFLVEEILGEPAPKVEIDPEPFTQRAREARSFGDRLARFSAEKRQEALRRAEVSPELVYEIYRRADEEWETEDAYVWTDHLLQLALRVDVSGPRGAEIQEALVPGYTLRLRLALDLVLPWDEVEETAALLMDAVKEDGPDHHDMLRAWQVLGRYCREKNQLYLAESFLLLSERWAREYRLDADRALAQIELARLALAREELIPASVYVIDGLMALDRDRNLDPDLLAHFWLVATRVVIESGEGWVISKGVKTFRNLIPEELPRSASWIKSLEPWIEAKLLETEGSDGIDRLFEQAEEVVLRDAPFEAIGEFWVTQIRLDRVRIACEAGDIETVRQLLVTHAQEVVAYAPGVSDILADLATIVDVLKPIDVVSAARYIEQLGVRAFQLPVQ